MRKQCIVRIDNGVCPIPEFAMRHPFSLQLLEGEQIAITGPNGGGKTMLVDILRGRHNLQIPQPYYDFSPSSKPYFSDNIRYIAFRDSYGSVDQTYFLQQRWESQEMDPEMPTVGQLLDRAYLAEGEDTPERDSLRQQLYDIFQMRPLLDKPIILLSSGELRKYVITRTLFAEARLLIIDNPFIGLDASTRDQLKMLLAAYVARTSTLMVLVLSKTDDIPDFITHVVEVNDRTVAPKVTREEYLDHLQAVTLPSLAEDKRLSILQLPARTDDYMAEEVVAMRQVTIRYGERTILKDLSWTVRNGERWALRGENGAGKTTLLSLICADNPQSYACDIVLFGRQRGSGESIWDIKRHIGYVSPEMHRSYHRDLPAIRIVASGLKDTIGLYAVPTEEEYRQCRWWMEVFGIGKLADRSFLQMSTGEQRLVLLARAFVKDPELLILDEPLHGLDDANRQMVKEIIDTFCQRPGKTLIMVTHYEEELPTCIDHTLFLKKNR
ncbi:MAG: ATP-binding cassette domain-containing protein [Prevotella sp.]